MVGPGDLHRNWLHVYTFNGILHVVKKNKQTNKLKSG